MKVDYIIADLWQLLQYQAGLKEERGQLRELTAAIDQLNSQGEYGITHFQDGVILWQQSVRSEAVALIAWQQFRRELEGILKT